MRIALLAPLPPEQTGIADYAEHFRKALVQLGIEVITPLQSLNAAPLEQHLARVDWSQIDLVHGELGGGRLREFAALNWLRQHQPKLPLTATVHDPERLVWRRAQLPWPLSWLSALPYPAPQAAAVLIDPLTLYEERRLAQHLTAAITLTRTGAECLAQRMKLASNKVHSIAHGNLEIAAQPLPPLKPFKLLYFGFIYRGKGIEDLLAALAQVLQRQPQLAGQVELTLAGGTAPDMAFDPAGNYLEELKTLAEQLSLTECLRWQLDLPAEQIAQTLAAHHVLVLPYRESKKLSILGQMRGTSGALSWANACGRGVISSNARAFAEEVGYGNGATFAQGQVEALAQELEQLLLTPEQAVCWAEQASEIGKQRSWPHTAQRFAQLFSQVIESRAHV